MPGVETVSQAGTIAAQKPSPVPKNARTYIRPETPCIAGFLAFWRTPRTRKKQATLFQIGRIYIMLNLWYDRYNTIPRWHGEKHAA